MTIQRKHFLTMQCNYFLWHDVILNKAMLKTRYRERCYHSHFCCFEYVKYSTERTFRVQHVFLTYVLENKLKFKIYLVS